MSFLALLTGFLVSAAWVTQTTARERLAALPPDIRSQVAAGTLDLAAELTKAREELAKVREEKSKLESTLAEQGNASQQINESLKETRLFAALTDVEGEGLIVTLSDSKKPVEEMMLASEGIVHYLDVLKVVNELFNAGAEAVAVNGIRIGPGTDLRCVGTTILVDAQKIAPPVEIQAIGETATLLGAMNMPGGILEELRTVDVNMVKIEPAKKLFLPAYDGATTFKVAKVPEAKN